MAFNIYCTYFSIFKNIIQTIEKCTLNAPSYSHSLHKTNPIIIAHVIMFLFAKDLFAMYVTMLEKKKNTVCVVLTNNNLNEIKDSGS